MTGEAERSGTPDAGAGDAGADGPGVVGPSTERSEVVRAEGLGKDFDDGPERVRAVVDADLAIRRGEVLLVLGASGAGKTTLLSMLGCVLAPSRGSLTVCGREVTTLPAVELARVRLRRLGFVFQTFRLVDALTAAENVEVPLNLAGLRRPRSRERARQLLEEVGLAARADFLPRALSAGERQRAAVARALALKPDLLLADEPTGSLDSVAGARVLDLLVRAAREREAAVLIVSHDPAIRPRADRVMRMEDGRLKAE